MKEFDLAGLHEDHSLKAQVAPPLSELCVRIIAENFSNRPTLRGIPTRFVDRVTELLPTTLPLDVTGPLIDDEPYWQRCASARWDNCQISDHGSSWKRLYFERNLADFLESFDPKTQDTEDLTRTLTVSKDYIFSLHVKQFLSHLDLEMLFQNVPTLCHLDMTYGVKSIGMDYERTLFGMKLLDVTSLAKALRVTETLTILSLPCNLLDDNTVRILASGLQGNMTITALDLSHNKIADRGVKALAKLLDDRAVLVALNLSDNHVHADGGKYFGRALKLNSSLQSLNLRLNRLGDEGGKMLLDGMLDNSTLTQLNLSCNALEFDSAQTVGAIVGSNTSLRALDLSCNSLSEEAGRLLREGLHSNTTLSSMDLRLNQITVDTVAAVEDACKKNKLEAHRARREYLEAVRLQETGSG